MLGRDRTLDFSKPPLSSLHFLRGQPAHILRNRYKPTRALNGFGTKPYRFLHVPRRRTNIRTFPVRATGQEFFSIEGGKTTAESGRAIQLDDVRTSVLLPYKPPTWASRPSHPQEAALAGRLPQGGRRPCAVLVAPWRGRKERPWCGRSPFCCAFHHDRRKLAFDEPV